MSLCVVSYFLLITEIMRKINKAILFTLHYFGPVAHIEIASVLGYMIMVWGTYIGGYSLTSFLLIASLLVCSCITNMLFARLLVMEYYKVPAGDVLSAKQIVLIKCRSLMCSTTRFIFSGNSIVPLTAAFMGTTYAGGIKVAQTLIQNGTTLADRIFCMNSALLFSYLQHATDSRTILHIIYRVIIPLLGIGTLFLYFLIYLLMYYKGMLTLLPLISLYILMQCIDIGATIFERFLLAKSHPYLLHLQLSTTIFCGCLLYCGSYIGYAYMLCALVIVRFMSLCSVIYLTRATQKCQSFEFSTSHKLPFEFSARQVGENNANQDRL
jgi:hypothetical protein